MSENRQTLRKLNASDEKILFFFSFLDNFFEKYFGKLYNSPFIAFLNQLTVESIRSYARVCVGVLCPGFV